MFLEKRIKKINFHIYYFYFFITFLKKKKINRNFYLIFKLLNSFNIE
jgi:hypothetical protein